MNGDVEQYYKNIYCHMIRHDSKVAAIMCNTHIGGHIMKFAIRRMLLAALFGGVAGLTAHAEAGSVSQEPGVGPVDPTCVTDVLTIRVADPAAYPIGPLSFSASPAGAKGLAVARDGIAASGAPGASSIFAGGLTRSNDNVSSLSLGGAGGGRSAASRAGNASSRPPSRVPPSVAIANGLRRDLVVGGRSPRFPDGFTPPGLNVDRTPPGCAPAAVPAPAAVYMGAAAFAALTAWRLRRRSMNQEASSL